MEKVISVKNEQVIEKYKPYEEIIHQEAKLAGVTNRKFTKPWTWENKVSLKSGEVSILMI